jgi:quercetin dioxygenase-like cupin family protein
MEIIDLYGQKEFSPTRHIHKTLTSTPQSEISVVGWEPGQKSPIHCHPTADEIYHVLEGEGLFNDGARELTLKPGDTVLFAAGEVHTVVALTRMVLYRVQAGSDRRAKALDAWPVK